jgi:hypothetical protein
MSRHVLWAATLWPILAAPLAAQATTGQIVGQVTDTLARPLAGVEVVLQPAGRQLTTNERGEFVFVAVPPGRHRLLARSVGYRPTEVTDVLVQAGGFVRLTIELAPGPITLEPLSVRGEERALVAPDVNASTETVGRETLETLPVQTVAEVVELGVGVTDGRFRGGRIGQAEVTVDGIDLKNPFAAQTGGAGFEFSPSVLEEVTISTSGFGVDEAAALSGAVRLVTRTGRSDRWRGRVDWIGDEIFPSDLARGYGRLGVSADGPVAGGVTALADFSFTGLADAEPRLNGLTCLDAQEFCFAQRDRIPHQRGDRYTALLKLDRTTTHGGLTLLATRNRFQRELYSTRYRYNLDGYLGERQTSTAVGLSGRWLIQPQSARAMLITAHAAYLKFDNYLGVLEPDQPGSVGRFQFGNFRFRGEAEARDGRGGLPGYVEPTNPGSQTPYGFLGSDLFVDGGTSGVAGWTGTGSWDLAARIQAVISPQVEIEGGTDLKAHSLDHYETTRAWDPSTMPTLASAKPWNAGVFAVTRLRTTDGLNVELGLRLEGFRPAVDTVPGAASVSWTFLTLPRIGVAAPLSFVGLDRVVARFNFGRYAQPPDFRFFFDTELDDSLNTALRRQGTATLGFERATAYEGGVGFILTDYAALHLVGFYKDLTGITTSAIAVPGVPGAAFSNLDFGTSRGVEARLEARWAPDRRARVGYSLSETIAVVSSVFDSVPDPTAPRIEIPLQFDRRHVFDVDGIYGTAAPFEGRIAASIAGTVASGYPIPGDITRRLPWTVDLTGRLTYSKTVRSGDLALFLEARNLIGWDNLRTARVASGGVDPDVEALDQQARAETALNDDYPQESPYYVPQFDADGDGYVRTSEQYQARRAALLDLFEPTLLYGAPRTLRIGVTWTF